jgi:hypothetical protein
MLDDKVLLCFRDLMEAELRPRDHSILVQVRASDRLGSAASGRAVFARVGIGEAELSERAKIVWEGLKRCMGAYQKSAPADSMKSDINEQLRYWIAGESNVIRGLVDSEWGPAAARAQVLGLIVKRQDDLVRKYQTEASFYVHELMNPPKKPEPPAAVNIGANFGAVAVGRGAQAHSHTEIAGNVQLVQSLEELRASFEQAPALTPEQRSDSLGVIAEAINAAREPKPNKLKLSGLLSGVAGAVAFLADAPDAWESVKAAAAIVGITLP